MTVPASLAATSSAPCHLVVGCRLPPSPDHTLSHLRLGQGAANPPSPRIWARRTEHFILCALPRCHSLVCWVILGARLGDWHTHRAAGNSLLLFQKSWRLGACWDSPLWFPRSDPPLAGTGATLPSQTELVPISTGETGGESCPPRHFNPSGRRL